MENFKTGFYSELVSALRNSRFDKAEFSRLKSSLASKYSLKSIPTDIEVMLNLPEESRKHIKLVTKPTRTVSGVAVVALMSAPLSCPHGRCVFCPGGPGSVFGDVPQSYTGKEPSTMRAIRAGYDPYVIMFNRLEQYAVSGHSFGKVEVIVQGGTFPSYDWSYQEMFVREAFAAMNSFSRLFFRREGKWEGELDFVGFKDFFDLPGEVGSSERMRKVHSRIFEAKNSSQARSLEEEQEENESSNVRCVALCIETKPDFSKSEHINDMLRLGTTRVELGVQTLYDDVLSRVNRGHTLQDTLEAVQLLKDSFLKVGFHMMPGLPGSDYQRDIAMFRELFENPAYMPDNLKVYPCMVMPGTELYDDWKRGDFAPLSTREAAEIIAESKRFVPEYCRVMRVQRDIPTYVTSAGVDRTNLRQYVDMIRAEQGIFCRCIRCREPMSRKFDLGRAEIIVRRYASSGGTEVFISAEDVSSDVMLGFCRLRIPFRPFRPEITPGSAGVRELHVFGPAASLNRVGSVQHRGFGKLLLSEAERAARDELGVEKLLVISGVGARNYYRKLGYERDGAYMGKRL
ncbi:tRNA uridine(34) 5-carboxymethylaminomethyl modification radical SAM/GNAT enzyme Elp3 [Candidatus Woesearchaeota archaeon]|nr:tRNA uridine(34) 5-carboxymethylaminomethyl modification radical SAM/GNAT enzyme Elp3 [Candidatus Woesearchaeota archaeon]